MATASRRRVQFSAPGKVDVVSEDLKSPAEGEVQVRTMYSAISPGTERLVYEGNAPDDVETDPSIDALQDGGFSYPLSYGYACVGTVEQVGREVDDTWLGATVFAFHPHASRFVTRPDELVVLPDEIKMTDAVLIPALETAVNLLMDGSPVIGETVIVFGQGVVGLLTTRLLAEHPLEDILTLDSRSARCDLSKEMGATETGRALSDLNTLDFEKHSSSKTYAYGPEGGRADLVYELTGTPSVLNDAIESTGFGGRLVIGSWYGKKRAPVNLGGHFHRSRMRIISSQVSTIDPEYRGRWTKSRRMSVVVDLLDEVNPGQLVSDTFSIDDAPTVYEHLASDEPMLQPLFVYE